MESTHIIQKVLIADDHSLLRNGLKQLLKQEWKDITVVESKNYQQTLDVMNSHSDIDLVLFDLTMPGMDSFKVLETLVNNDSAVPVIVVTASDEISDMKRAFDIGALGFINKSESNEVMLSAIQLVLSGGVYIPPIMARTQVNNNSSPLSTLTLRQHEVLNFIMRGFPNKEIASALGLAEVTVKTHVSAILKNLGVVNRTQAVVVVKELGYGDDSSS